MAQRKKNHALSGKFSPKIFKRSKQYMSKITFSYVKEEEQRTILLLGHGVFTTSRLQGRVNLVHHLMKAFVPN